MPRDICHRCERPSKVCICTGLEAFAPPVQVVILQTAREKKHAVNSGRIVRLGVAGCQVFYGEDFSGHSALTELLNKWHGKTWLLYPGDEAITPAKVVEESGGYGEGLLLVLDATWRKSKKMLYLDPRLQALPRVALPDAMESSYKIRKVPGQGYLSTVEAVSSCLMQMGHPHKGCEQMLLSFERMVDFQIQAMGREVFENNYAF